MDVNPTRAQDPATGDDELAKVLAGVSDAPATNTSGLQFEETPAPQVQGTTTSQPASTPTETTTEPQTDLSVPAPSTNTDPPVLLNGGLDDIKKSALEELRPLVNKLNLSPEEKFDTILLIIRSTDDRSLVEAAYESAKAITDETKRAQALLDVIKEIDYFATKQGAAA